MNNSTRRLLLPILALSLAAISRATDRAIVDSNTVHWDASVSAQGKANVVTQQHVTSDSSGVKLAGDAASPGNWQFYGTDGSGNPGFFAFSFSNLQGTSNIILDTGSYTDPAWLNLTKAKVGLGDIESAEVDVASATTADIGAAGVDNIRITGTTTITALGTVAAGVRRVVRFAAALTLTHNGTSLILPNAGNNIVTAAGDAMLAESFGGGNWKVLLYQRADGTALQGGVGGGNLNNSGTPTSGQLGVFVDATHLQGVAASSQADTILGGLSTNGYVKRTGPNTYTIDSSTFLTAGGTNAFTGNNTHTGTESFTGALVLVSRPTTSHAIDFATRSNSEALTGNITASIAGSSHTADRWTNWCYNADTTDRTVALPAGVRAYGSSTDLASMVIPASSTQCGTLYDDGTYYWISGNPVVSDGTGPFTRRSALIAGEATLSDGATTTQTMIAGQEDQNAVWTVGGNRTLVFSGLVAGMRGNLRVIEDSTGGRAITLPANSKVVNGGAGAVSLTATAGAVDILSWYSPDGTLIYWTIGKNFT